MADIFQKPFLNIFTWIKIVEHGISDYTHYYV